jgi:hypothetical protein
MLKISNSKSCEINTKMGTHFLGTKQSNTTNHKIKGKPNSIGLDRA